MSWNRDADWEYIADGLDRMADLLPGRWAQGDEVDPPLDYELLPDKTMCVGVAINYEFMTGPMVRDVIEVFCEETGIEIKGYLMKGIVNWNDHVCENEQQAIDACRGSAKRARMRAEGIEADRMIQRMTTL